MHTGAYISRIFTNVITSIKNMSRKFEDNTAARRQSYSRPTSHKAFKEDIYKFLHDFKTEQLAVLARLTNEVVGLKDCLIETKNEGDRRQIKKKNDITYAELQFPLERQKNVSFIHNKTQEQNTFKEQSICEVHQQQNDIQQPSFEADLQRKVDNLTKENEINSKRIDVMQNQLNLFQQKLQELEMKEDRMKEKDTLCQTIKDCCQNICYQHFSDISQTIMALWEGNTHVFI